MTLPYKGCAINCNCAVSGVLPPWKQAIFIKMLPFVAKRCYDYPQERQAMTMTFGQAIKEKREKLGLTQQELAEKLFVSRQTVCRWENGTRCPDLIMAKKISIVLGIAMDDLIPTDAVQDYVPPKEVATDLSFVKVMLSGIMLLLIAVFFYVADGTGVYMDISGLCFIGGIITFLVGLFIPQEKKAAPIDDDLPQRQCPRCGKQHDFDYPQCPFCGHTY